MTHLCAKKVAPISLYNTYIHRLYAHLAKNIFNMFILLRFDCTCVSWGSWYRWIRILNQILKIPNGGFNMAEQNLTSCWTPTKLGRIENVVPNLHSRYWEGHFELRKSYSRFRFSVSKRYLLSFKFNCLSSFYLPNLIESFEFKKSDIWFRFGILKNLDN